MIGVSLGFKPTTAAAEGSRWSSSSAPLQQVRRPRSALPRRVPGVERRQGRVPSPASASSRGNACAGYFGEASNGTGETASTPAPDAVPPCGPFSHADGDGESPGFSQGPSPVLVEQLGLRRLPVTLSSQGGRPRQRNTFIALPEATGVSRKAAMPRPRSAASMRGAPIVPAASAIERRQSARDIELALREDLARLPPDSKVARLTVHRRALCDYADSLDDECARSLLMSVVHEYDALRFERVDEEMQSLVERVRDVQHSQEQSRELLRRQQRANGELTLEIENLRRQLANRNEMLAQIAATHNITVAGIDGDAAGAKSHTAAPERTLTLTDIRQNQNRVAEKYGDFVRPTSLSAAEELEGAGRPLDDLVPNDVSDIGKPAPSQERTARAQATHLQLFHNSRGPAESAVDLEANVPPELQAEV
uniref:Uncharacterized protein n=2 Tax=Neobodo designis TaxID=312471 RepID=A0A7S1PMS3_NEODS